MDGEQDDDCIFIEHLRRHSSQLSSNTYRIYVSHTGEIISTYTDPENDPTYCVHYPFLHEISIPEGIQTVRRDELEELERLGPDVDLVAYRSCPEASAEKVEPRIQVVFKYYWIWQYTKSSWKEMNLWMRLPRHPNNVPFDRIVIDELEGRVVGFTNIYVPGGNLENNKSRVFKLKWLQQLIKDVDDLNLRYGIAHQDIAPRNLVVDELTDSVMLFDFNFAARMNRSEEGESYNEDRNDVKGVIFTMYEIITRDSSLRRIPHEDQKLDALGKNWLKHSEVKLDHLVASYQLMLQEWQERRARDRNAVRVGDFPEAIHWPSGPDLPQEIITLRDAQGQPSLDRWPETERRQDVRDRGGKVLNWERPPQRLVDNGMRVLSNGEVINCLEINC